MLFEFRRNQAWVSGATPTLAHFVPPPPEALDEILTAFERFGHLPSVHVPPLIKAALAHVQFETIHPFSDGNGRLGRRLIALILRNEGVPRDPQPVPQPVLQAPPRRLLQAAQRGAGQR